MPYAIDGVAIFVNPKNPNDGITMEQLKAIFAHQVTNWSDGKPIMTINRPPAFGTRGVFHEKVFGADLFDDGAVYVKPLQVAPNTDTVLNLPIAGQGAF